MLAVIANCLTVLVINNSDLPLNKVDGIIILKAHANCQRVYNEGYCAKKVIKISYNNYHLICARQNG